MDDDEDDYDDVAELVMAWIADSALQYASQDGSSISSSVALQLFHPRELSRLVWSIATVFPERGTTGWPTVSIETLAYHALVTAASNLAVFETEDLVSMHSEHQHLFGFLFLTLSFFQRQARIVWAFLSLTDSAESFTWPHVADSLGKIFATIELCLIQWERGRLSFPKNQTQLSEPVESTRFASFFGQSRFHIPFLDQHVGDPLDDMDETHTSILEMKSRLPLLRDLPLDPLTLCKAASCFTKLMADNLLQTSDTLARVAMRLLTSRGGRLLRECPLSDLVRLLEALALSDAAGTRELIGYFTRQVIHLINDSPQDESGSIPLKLRPTDLSTFIWSLGKLGVTYSTSGGDKSLAHRRLHLVAKPRLMDRSKFDTLSIPSAIRLVSNS
jgi:hypothetical protein